MIVGIVKRIKLVTNKTAIIVIVVLTCYTKLKKIEVTTLAASQNSIGNTLTAIVSTTNAITVTSTGFELIKFINIINTLVG